QIHSVPGFAPKTDGGVPHPAGRRFIRRPRWISVLRLRGLPGCRHCGFLGVAVRGPEGRQQQEAGEEPGAPG
ncbi:MAG: hypothetical protein ABIG68_04720, partial [Acidobacteriota bacterium]